MDNPDVVLIQSTDSKRLCIYCKTELKHEARFCSECKHYQSRAYNWLPFIGGLAGIFVILTTGVLFFWNRWQDMQAYSTGSVSLKLVSAKSDGSIAVINNGERSLFLSHIIFETRHAKRSRAISKIAKGGEFLSIDYISPDGKRDNYKCVVGEENVKGIISDSLMVVNQDYLWYTYGHPDLLGHIELDTHAIISGKAKLVYYSFGDFEPHELSIDCSVMVVQRPSADGTYPDSSVHLGGIPLQQKSFKEPVKGHPFEPVRAPLPVSP